MLSDVDTEIQKKSLCPFSATQHKDLVKTLFFTGIRTTAVTLEWIILYMASQPDKLNEIQNEIGTLSEAGKLSLNNIPKLEYLERFITEVMRIAPIAHTHARQVKASFEYENRKFRAGDILLLSVFGKIDREPGAAVSTQNRSVDPVHPGHDKAHSSMARHDQTWLHRGLLLEKRI